MVYYRVSSARQGVRGRYHPLRETAKHSRRVGSGETAAQEHELVSTRAPTFLPIRQPSAEISHANNVAETTGSTRAAPVTLSAYHITP